MSWEGLVTKKEEQSRHRHLTTYRSIYPVTSTEEDFRSISFDRRRGLEEDKVQVQIASKTVEVTSEVVKADTPAN